MAAVDEFPRGGFASDLPAVASAASITLPACSGIVHILDSFYAFATNTSSANLDDFTVNVSTASLGTITLGKVLVTTTAGDSGSDSQDDLGIVSAPGEAMTIAFAGDAADVQQFLRIAWHDI